jgi:hypothetical protein
MPTESVNVLGENPYFTVLWKERVWNHSERIGGKLRLRNNPYTFSGGAYGSRSYPAGYYTWLPSKPPSGWDVPYVVSQQYAVDQLEGRCYNSLRSKLYKGSAALGVTLGSMAQSRDMVVKRANTLRMKGADIVADITSVQRRHGLQGTKTLEAVANAHLEVIFGWTPLVADIVAATQTVCQLAGVNVFLEASASTNGYARSGMDTYSTKSRVAYSVAVRIDNPNLWLAERAGALNPLSVAWDLVPWSFVVNMFVNTGQLVQQVTDFAGLEFSDIWRTDTVSYRCARDASEYGVPVRGFWKGIDKRRTMSAFPKPPGLTMRLPNADWATAAMAASLFIQQFTKVSRLIAPYEHQLRRLRRGGYTE